MKVDVTQYCKTSYACQVAGKLNQFSPKAPLIPIPAGQEPFSRIISDCVGPLPRSRSCWSYLFTIMCATTRYPAAFLLRSINAKNICEALISFFSIFGLPRIVQTNQGSTIISKIFQQLAKKTLGIKHVYHPESQGAVERFHQTLKSMLRTCCEEHSDWQAGIPLLLFAVRGTIQEYFGFALNERRGVYWSRGVYAQ